jgi:hypothetical protein
MIQRSLATRSSPRKRTPLEILNRDHNWRQGSLKRLLVNVQMIQDPVDCAQAIALVYNEIDRTRNKFEEAKQELLNS